MSTSRPIIIQIPPNESPTRLDVALTRALEGRHSRTEIARLIREGRVLVNGRPVKRPAFEVEPGHELRLDVPPAVPCEIPAEDLPLQIVFEDEDLAVIDKPAGMVTHPAGALRSGTLVNALLAHISDLSGVGGVMRPGIVHRLDKGTTGLLVVAKHDESHRALASQLEARTLKRTYEAVAWGRVSPDHFSIDAPIARHPRDRKRMGVVRGGKEAISHVEVLEASEVASHVDVRLETGRTHQIRVHLQHRGHALVGDTQYPGRRRALAGVSPAGLRLADSVLPLIDRPCLHARRLELVHPRTKDIHSFESPRPADIQRVLDALFPG